MKNYFVNCDIGGFNSDNFDFPLLIAEFQRCGIEFPSWELNFIDMLTIERIVNSHKLLEVYKTKKGTPEAKQAEQLLVKLINDEPLYLSIEKKKEEIVYLFNR